MQIFDGVYLRRPAPPLALEAALLAAAGLLLVALVRKERETREQLFRRMRLDFVNVRTDQPYVDALVAFFRARTRRMKH